MGEYLLGIDRGTSNVKVAAFDLSGAEVSSVTQPSQPISTPAAGWAEQDMDQIWQDVCAALSRLWDDRVTPNSIIAVGLSGQGGGLFALDVNGRPVRPGIVSLDSRVVISAGDWAVDDAHADFLTEWAGGAPSTPLALLYWLKVCEPGSYDQIRWILQSKDWVRYRLTGELAYETTDASNGHLLDRTGKYDLSSFAAVGMDETAQWLPTLLQPWDLAGTVNKQAAIETGLLEGTPVAAGGHDCAVMPLGAGRVDAGDLTTVLGTWGLNFLLQPSERAIVVPETKVVLSTMPGMSQTMNGASTGKAIDWFVDTIFADPARSSPESKHDVLTRMEQEVLAAGRSSESDIICHPFTEPLLLNKYAGARAGIYGLTGQHTRVQLIRSMYEGIALVEAVFVEALASALPLETMHLVGGGSKSDLLGQLIADATGLQVLVPRVDEVGCRGAALLAGMAIGHFADHRELGSLPIPLRSGFEPTSHGRTRMSAQLANFETFAQRTRDVWEGPTSAP